MIESESILFLFTKEFPYGNMEQYLAEEVAFLSGSFSKVILVPCELFERKNKTERTLPPNFVVLDINSELKENSVSARGFSKFKVLISEFLHEKDKWRFIKEFPRYRAILNYQCKMAAYFERYLLNFSNNKKFFYSYWLHNPAVMLSLLKKKGVIKSFISRAHSIDLYHNDWPFAYSPGVKVLPFQFFKTSMASAVFSVSKAGENYLRNKFPALRSNFFTSYLGVSDRGRGGWNEDDVFTIVSCSAANPHKRVSRIAKIFSGIRFPARWIHFGEGPEMNSVREIISDLPQHLSVNLRGYTSNSQIMQFYQTTTVHLFINLSSVEGIPVSLMEAASFGIPLLATDVYGNSEIVNETTGFLIPGEFEDDDVLKVIDSFANDKRKQEELRISSRNFCLQTFNNSKNFSEFAQQIHMYQN